DRAGLEGRPEVAILPGELVRFHESGHLSEWSGMRSLRIGPPRIGMMRRGSIVLGQQVCAPVPLEFPPHAVDVVGMVLGVVVLDQERRALNAVIGTLALLEAAHPR